MSTRPGGPYKGCDVPRDTLESLPRSMWQDLPKRLGKLRPSEGDPRSSSHGLPSQCWLGPRSAAPFQHAPALAHAAWPAPCQESRAQGVESMGAFFKV